MKSLVFNTSKQKDNEPISKPNVKIRAAKNKNNSFKFCAKVFPLDSKTYRV